MVGEQAAKKRSAPIHQPRNFRIHPATNDECGLVASGQTDQVVAIRLLELKLLFARKPPDRHKK